jgi:EmrB/QacA subfamily drug resistance transporter
VAFSPCLGAPRSPSTLATWRRWLRRAGAAVCGPAKVFRGRAGGQGRLSAASHGGSGRVKLKDALTSTGLGADLRTTAFGRLPRPRPATAAATAYVAALFMAAMDAQIVNVALPTLKRDFGTSLAAVQWTVLGYLLALAVVIPASGWLGDRIGTKRTFIIALATFTIASTLCGLAQSLGELIAARALQGVGGGMLTPMGTAMLYRAYAPERRAAVARTLIVPMLVGPGIAPIVGGLFTEHLSWRWVFFVNVPIGAVMLVYAQAFLEEHRSPAPGRLDVRGLLLSGAGLSLLLYAISQGSAAGWASPEILATAIAGIAALAAFVNRSRGKLDSILRLSLLRDRLFRATNVTISLAHCSFIGSLYLTPLFLQEVLHQSPVASGLTTFVEAIGAAVAAQTLGRLYPRLGPRVMAASSSVTVAAVLGCLTLAGPGTNLWWVRGAMFLAGMANSGNLLAAQSAMFTNVSPADIGHASAIYTTNRQTSIAAGVAILTTIVAGIGHPSTTAFHVAYAADAAIALLGGIAAVALIRTNDARATMRAR